MPEYGEFQIIHDEQDPESWFIINGEGYELSSYHTEDEAKAFMDGLLFGE